MFIVYLHLPSQIEGKANPPLHGRWAILLLSWKGIMVTPSALRRRVAISFTLRHVYSVYFVYLHYICSAGVTTSTFLSKLKDMQILLSWGGGHHPP